MERGLLYFMYGNLQMGTLTTKHLIKICPDEKLRASLLEDLHAMEKFENAILALKDSNEQLKPVNSIVEKNTELGIDMKTLFSKDTDKLCKMLVTGYEKGIESLNENMAKHKNESDEAIQLAKGYMNFLKECRAKYKGF